MRFLNWLCHQRSDSDDDAPVSQLDPLIASKHASLASRKRIELARWRMLGAGPVIHHGLDIIDGEDGMPSLL
jgi:hypothetical protein